MFTHNIVENIEYVDVNIFILEAALEFINIENAMMITETELKIKQAYAEVSENESVLSETTMLMEEEDKGFWKSISDWLKSVKDWFIKLFSKVKDGIINKVISDAKWVNENKKTIQAGLVVYSKLDAEKKKKYDDMESLKSSFVDSVDDVDRAIGSGLQVIKSDKFEESYLTKLVDSITEFDKIKQEKESNVFKSAVDKGLSHFARDTVSKMRSTIDTVEKEFDVAHRELEKTVRSEDRDAMNKVKVSKKMVDSFLAKTLAFTESSTTTLNNNYMSFLKAAYALNKPSSKDNTKVTTKEDKKDE